MELNSELIVIGKVPAQVNLEAAERLPWHDKKAFATTRLGAKETPPSGQSAFLRVRLVGRQWCSLGREFLLGENRSPNHAQLSGCLLQNLLYEGESRPAHGQYNHIGRRMPL